MTHDGEHMSPTPTNLVPKTKMLIRHRESGQATALMKKVKEQGLDGFCSKLAEDFLGSIERLTRGTPVFDESATPFRAAAYLPTRRVTKTGEPVAPTDRPVRIDKARDIATALYETSGKMLHVAGAGWLDADYVDFELSALRKTNDARFFEEPEVRAGEALKVDLMLRSQAGTPAVCEVKLRSDKNALAGLIQGLAYIAHLASPQQYQRLRTFAGDPTGVTPPGFSTASAGEQPRFDLYIWLVDYAPSGGTVHKLHDTAPQVAEALMKGALLGSFVRRIVCVASSTDEIKGYLSANGEPRGTMPNTDTGLSARLEWVFEAAD